MKRIGSRAQVMHGNAKQTSGGLVKKDLKYNKYGKIVSKKKSDLAKKEKRLENAGYVTQKGIFGVKNNIKGGNNNINNINFQLTSISRRSSIQDVKSSENKKNAIMSITNKKFKNNYSQNIVNNFLNGLRNKTIQRLSRSGNVNPNNEIYIDKYNKKIYKFGLWNDRYRSIKNEFISYSLLNNTSNNNEKKHFPKLYDCVLIPDTKYAMLVIEYKENLKQYQYIEENAINNSNNNNLYMDNFNQNSKISNNLNINEKKKLYENTIAFLRNKGIFNEDIKGNLFYYTKNNQNIFYCIDFEEVEFKNNNNKKITYKNMNLPNEIKQKINNYNNLVENQRPKKSRRINLSNNILRGQLNFGNFENNE